MQTMYSTRTGRNWRYEAYKMTVGANLLTNHLHTTLVFASVQSHFHLEPTHGQAHHTSPRHMQLTDVGSLTCHNAVLTD